MHVVFSVGLIQTVPGGGDTCQGLLCSTPCGIGRVFLGTTCGTMAGLTGRVEANMHKVKAFNPATHLGYLQQCRNYSNTHPYLFHTAYMP